MTETPESTIAPERLPAAFTKAAGQARAAVFWERLWPKAVPPLAVTGLFLSASWAGAWGMMHPYARMASVAAFAIALVASPWRYKTGSLRVSREEGLKRLDENLGSPVNPAQQIGDRPSVHSTPQEKELWNLHISRLWNQYGDQFKAGMPHPGMAKRDPYHLRFMIALTMAITAATARAPLDELVKDAFDWRISGPVSELAAQKSKIMQVKAWITPPENIDREPVQLTEETRDEGHGGKAIEAHQQSKMTIMTYGESATVTLNGQPLTVQKEIKQSEGVSAYQYEIELAPPLAKIVIDKGPTWNIKVTQDLPPQVTLESIVPKKDDGRSNRSGNALDIDYKAKDDFGYQGQIVITGPEERKDQAAKPLPSSKAPVFILP
ncbi:MAG: DUF4175 family protein [Micavibrio sp.]